MLIVRKTYKYNYVSLQGSVNLSPSIQKLVEIVLCQCKVFRYLGVDKMHEIE